MPMSQTETAQPARQPSRVALIADQLRATLLPGESSFTEAELASAAAFLAAAAAARQGPGAKVVIEPVPTVRGESVGVGAGVGDAARATRIAVINRDMPFLVDSVAACLAELGLAVSRLVHPVVPGSDGDGPGESMIYIETRPLDASARRALDEALEATLADVHAAVDDWAALRGVMQADAEALAARDRLEGAALLRWFASGMLVQLGHCRHARAGQTGAALGICRTSTPAPLSDFSIERAFALFDANLAEGTKDHRWPLIAKAGCHSLVHRRVPLDLFLVPEIVDEKVVGLSIHAGIWTSAALATPPQHVPRLRAQLAKLTDAHGFAAGGHDGKALVHVLTKLPHDLMVSFADADLDRVALTLMGLIDRPRPRLILVEGPLRRHLFAFVWLPRDALSTDLRREIADMLERGAHAKVIDWAIEVESNAVAELRFTLDLRDAEAKRPNEAALDARLHAMLRGWAEALAVELGAVGARGRADTLAERYAEAIPMAYRGVYGAAEAAIDIVHLVALSSPAKGGDHAGNAAARRDERRGVRLYRLASDRPDRLRLKIYQRRDTLILSDIVPALENFGFRVADSFPTEIGTAGHALGHIHDFLLGIGRHGGVDQIAAALAAGPMIEAALAGVINGEAEDDGFNRLVLAAGLSAEEANWLRAWYRYLRQAGLGFDLATVVSALAAAPGVTRAVIGLFRARHDPATASAAGSGPSEAEIEAEAAIAAGLAEVAAINDDRLLRAFRGVVLAMLRTNAFSPAGREALAFKFASGLVPGLPKPLPWREIFVYSPRVEGIHLRAGPVARGGLRWSDRRDDFRTEVLGLMKAQRVKNAVIVPTGAKGGFYPKLLPNPAQDREGWAAEGRASYQVFIRALLSLTDNIIDGAVVHPANMVVRDDNAGKGDPYFVVAADKGTATFSDTANALAAEAHFWLDDAFASGGSKGYDHKAMGITAKGAWISVQRHFGEIGVDVQTDPVGVVGVGDMSGDVFGNGMLLSSAIRLVAAFDHRHIFLDPNPDPAASHAERARLFALPRSSWADYDAALISPGGGVFPRGQKTIPLSPEIGAALGLVGETIDPEALIRAILTAPVDLLWFGGIGTYIRATHEANAEVGDPANDAIRVTAKTVRARVIGEGANLGLTQAARIEFGLAGGRINTDFIDNSAGVDCSDKEVNIKIALASAKAAGRLDEAGRVALLVSMTEDVAALVLEDNRLQALALSVAEAAGAEGVAPAIRLIETLEETGQLDRATEGLADNDALLRRAMGGVGLTRSELAVLLASAKLAVQAALEASPVPDDPGLADELIAAFPPAMRETFAADIAHHRLRREIIATRLANRLINRLGPLHPFELADEAGAGLAEVTASFLAAEALFGLEPLWARIEAEAMPEAARLALIATVARALRTHMADLLRIGGAMVAPFTAAAELAPGVHEIAQAAGELLRAEGSAHSARMLAELTAAGAPVALAADVTRVADLDGAVGLAELARERGEPVVALTDAFTALGAALGLDWAQTVAATMAPADPWERLLAAGLARDFQTMRLDFLRTLAFTGAPEAAVETWLTAHEGGVRRLRAMVDRARLATAPRAAMLAQIGAQARNLLTK